MPLPLKLTEPRPLLMLAALTVKVSVASGSVSLVIAFFVTLWSSSVVAVSGLVVVVTQRGAAPDDEIHAKTIDYVGVLPAPSNGCRAAGPQNKSPKVPFKSGSPTCYT